MSIPSTHKTMVKLTDTQQKLITLFSENRLPSSMILAGPQHINLLELSKQFLQYGLCASKNNCGFCPTCHLMNENSHPDITFIEPEGDSKMIKIDQIRNIQQRVYQTPQRGDYSAIIINPAERMNMAASNALLKLLEEPPEHVIFILLTEQLHTLLPTVRSRCQKFIISEQQIGNKLEVGTFYPESTPRGRLYKQSHDMLEALCQIVEGDLSPCTVAQSWNEHPLDDLLWWLYLLHAQLIESQFNHKNIASNAMKHLVKRLAERVNPHDLYALNDKICALRKKVSHNVTINQLLAIEDILIDYAGFAYV